MTEFKSQQPVAVESTKASLPNYHVVGANITSKELITGIARISAGLRAYQRRRTERTNNASLRPLMHRGPKLVGSR